MCSTVPRALHRQPSSKHAESSDAAGSRWHAVSSTLPSAWSSPTPKGRQKEQETNKTQGMSQCSRWDQWKKYPGPKAGPLPSKPTSIMFLHPGTPASLLPRQQHPAMTCTLFWPLKPHRPHGHPLAVQHVAGVSSCLHLPAEDLLVPGHPSSGSQLCRCLLHPTG